jgi:hypothetical protein
MKRVGSYWEFACTCCGHVIQTATRPDLEPRCPRCVAREHLEQAAAQFPAIIDGDARIHRALEAAYQRIAELEDEIAELRRGAA